MSFNDFLPQGIDSIKTKKPYINLGKLSEGEYRFRIVMRPIAGWLDWKDKKPMRFRPENKPNSPYDAAHPIRPFWAIYVWDYKQEGLYIMEITQNTIRCALEDLARNEDWGDLTKFDLKIKKSGVLKDTSYTVTPVPHKPMDAVIKQALTAAPVRLEALYDGGDPWTDLAPIAPAGLNDQQSAQLDTLLQKINDRKFQQELEANFQVASIHNIPEAEFPRAIRTLEDRINAKKEAKNDSRRMATVA